MFPFQQNNDEFWSHIYSNPYQEDIDQDIQDLIHGVSNQTNSMEKVQAHKISATSNANDHGGDIMHDEKKITRKEIERQRRQQISTLHASLRSLLPLESIKGKRSMSDHMNEAAKYIKHLKSNVKELSVKRDKLKNFSNSSTSEQRTEIPDHNLLGCVKVRPYLGGVEIVASRGSGEKGIPLSTVLEAVLEERFDVVSCCSTQKDERRYTTIQCQASDQNCVDSNGLQTKLNDLISLSGYVNSD